MQSAQGGRYRLLAGVGGAAVCAPGRGPAPGVAAPRVAVPRHGWGDVCGGVGSAFAQKDALFLYNLYKFYILSLKELTLKRIGAKMYSTN